MKKERIGTTATGKEILATFDPAHVRGWDFLEHAQASCAHLLMSDTLIIGAIGKPVEDGERLLELARHHRNQAELHQVECDRLEAERNIVWH